MKTIVAGSREFDDFFVMEEHMSYLPWEPSVVISGGAKGTDTTGEAWAREYKIPLVQMCAEWDKHGKAAGPIRNEEMAKAADACVVFWDGKSKGSKNMIDLAIKYGLVLKVVYV